MLTVITSLPIFAFLFYAAKNKLQQQLLLIFATALFYLLHNWRFGIIFFGFAIVNTFMIKIKFNRSAVGLFLGICFNLGLLIFFKYLPSVIPQMHGPLLANYLFPLGLSFYALQGISALVDSRGEQHSTVYKTTDLLLYLSFFPQLLMGPIIRLNKFAREVGYKKWKAHQLKRAFSFILLGILYKKVVADNLAQHTQWLNVPQFLSFSSINLSTQLFADYIRLYADFYGYSLAAYGMALLFGHKIMLNFRSPLKASSMTDFWRRWNISLSTFIRDYLYIPLGGNRLPLYQRSATLFFCLLAAGLWHGATAGFIIWGIFHAFILLLERIIAPHCIALTHYFSNRVRKLFSFFYTTTIISFSMIFFNLNSVSDTLLFFKHYLALVPIKQDLQQVFLILLFSLPIIIFDYLPARIRLRTIYHPYFCSFVLFIILTSFASELQFTYMRF